MPTTEETLLRLVLAAALGAVIGLEREFSGQRAGLRTHLLVALGACLFTEGSAFGFSFISHLPPSARLVGDPSRIAAQVVSGIGFLGAGAIIRYGLNVRGLTTAATLWVVAALGLAVALGLYFESLVCLLLTMVALVGLRPLRTRLRRRRRQGHEELVVETEPDADIASLIRPLSEANVELENIAIQDGEDSRRVTMVLRVPGPGHEIVARMASVTGVRDVEWRH